MNARPAGCLFTRNMDGSGSERWSQQLMEGSQDFTWLGGSQEPQRSIGVSGVTVVRPTAVSWSHGAMGRGGGARMPPTQPSLQQPALLPDPRDVTLARDIRVGLHTILSVMSSVPEQLKEVGVEMGRVVQCHQQEQQREPYHHEETRKVIRDTGDTLHALLTGLQEAVTRVREGQDQGASLQKEAMKKHDKQMDELIKGMERLGWRGSEQQGQEEQDEEEERRAHRERERLQEALTETKKEMRRQVRRLKAAATGRTASIEKSVEDLQEGVVKVRETLEEVRGLVASPLDSKDNSGGCSVSPAASSLRQMVASTRTGLDEVLASIRGVEQVLSGLSSHLFADISQAVRDALQQHSVILRANNNGGATCSSHPNSSISVSPTQRIFSAHRPVLPLNESFSLCQTSPVAHVSPITQVPPLDTHTTTTITTTSTHQAISTSTSDSSLHQLHHHHHHTPQQPPTSDSVHHPQTAPPPPHSTARNHSRPHPQPVNTRVDQPHRVNSNRAALPPQRPQQMNPHHSKPSQSQQLHPTAPRPQQSSARHSHSQHFNPRASHPQHLSSRPSVPQQTQPRPPRPQQPQARPPQLTQCHPQLKLRPQLPQQVTLRTLKPQQGNTDTHSSQRINIRVARVQKATPPKTGPPQQTQQARSVSNEVYSTSQPSQHPQPPSQPQHAACKQCPPSQQNSIPVSTQHYHNLRPRPRPHHYTAPKARSQPQQMKIVRPQSPPPQHKSIKKAPHFQHNHLPPQDNNLKKAPQHQHNHPPQHKNIQKAPQHQHNHLPSPPPPQQQHNNLKNGPQHQYSPTPPTQHSQHHQHNPTRVEPQHNKVRVTTVRRCIFKAAQSRPSQQHTSNCHTGPPQQYITNSPFTQQGRSTPHHGSTTQSTLLTSTPKPTCQPQPQTTAWGNQYPSSNPNTPGQWSQQEDDFNAGGILVDHEEIVTTSFDEGRPGNEEQEAEEEEEEEAENNDTSNRQVCLQCNPSRHCDNDAGVECQGDGDAGEGTEEGTAGGGRDCFSSASCELEWASTQRFTPQNTYPLVKFVSDGDGKDALDYDTTSTEDSPVMSPRNTLASLGGSPPPTGAPPSDPATQRQTRDMFSDSTRNAPQPNTGPTHHTFPRHVPAASVPRTVAVAAVAPSTPLPTGPEVTPNRSTTPWRVVVSSGMHGGKTTTTNSRTQTTPAVFQVNSTSAPVTGMKRRYLEEAREGKEQQEGSCGRTKRFLMSFSTPVPHLVLMSSSKGRLRANLADIV
ncbi:uncharacterized protein LOC135110257 [Scylla paramamosain]|uniref:uncharacterized protein LOC135110257 n=1 Tax=Scylla paramamosain TaxID=85552 RepID=UPI003083422B